MGLSTEWADILIRQGGIETARTNLAPLGELVPATNRNRVLSEKDFMDSVVAVAKGRGWLVYHTHDSRRSEPGFPDLVMLRGKRMIVAELKVGKNTLTLEQEEWMKAFEAAGVSECNEWYPANWGEIMEVLK